MFVIYNMLNRKGYPTNDLARKIWGMEADEYHEWMDRIYEKYKEKYGGMTLATFQILLPLMVDADALNRYNNEVSEYRALVAIDSLEKAKRIAQGESPLLKEKKYAWQLEKFMELARMVLEERKIPEEFWELL